MRRLLALALWLLALAVPAAAERTLVLAAASLQGVLEEMVAGREAPTVFSYAGSGALARQVAAGAPADLVILADPAWMDWLVTRGTVEAEGVVPLAGNSLVLIAPAGRGPVDPAALPRLLAGARLAMGQRDAVPAGSYGRAWLESAGLWAALEDRLAETDNVRAALALVARGEASYGLVYATDARAEPAVEVVFAVPPGSHAPISYPAAALSPRGAALLRHLRRPEARAILKARGFAEVTP
jgi:molybdate transport system substrate-binding protein